jgi:hypothetical protein
MLVMSPVGTWKYCHVGSPARPRLVGLVLLSDRSGFLGEPLSAAHPTFGGGAVNIPTVLARWGVHGSVVAR